MLDLGATALPIVLAQSCPRDWPLGSLDQLTGCFLASLYVVAGYMVGALLRTPILGSHVIGKGGGLMSQFSESWCGMVEGLVVTAQGHSEMTGSHVVTLW